MNAPGADEMDEWEYEYDQEETEAYYITLDLTSHLVPSLPGKRNPFRSNKSFAKTKTDKANAQSLHKSTSNVPAENGSDNVAKDAIQIIDLHSSKPLISYNNQFYTCHWATDTGTAVFLTAPNDNPDLEHLPLRSFRTFDLVGASSARLVGVPATIRPRVSPLEQPTITSAEPDKDEIITTTAEGETIRISEKGMKIDLPSTASQEKISQARFLERLSAIKRKRGQTDPIPIRAIKGYTRPENWEEERAEWLARERAEREASGMDEPATPAEEDKSQDVRDGSQSVEPAEKKTKGKGRARATPTGRRGSGRAAGRPRQIRLDSERTASPAEGSATPQDGSQESLGPEVEMTPVDGEQSAIPAEE